MHVTSYKRQGLNESVSENCENQKELGCGLFEGHPIKNLKFDFANLTGQNNTIFIILRILLLFVPTKSKLWSHDSASAAHQMENLFIKKGQI